MSGRQKVLIIIAGVILFILILVTTLINLSQRRKLAEPETTSELIDRFESQGRPLTEQQRRAIAKSLNANYFDFTPEEKQRLESLNSQLPYNSPAFEIAYSDLLNKYFINKKGENFDAEFRKFLEENGLLALYQKYPSLFEIVNVDDINTAIKNAEDFFLQTIDEEDESNETGAAGPSDSGLTTLVDLLKILVSFDAVEESAEQQEFQQGQEATGSDETDSETGSTGGSGSGSGGTGGGGGEPGGTSGDQTVNTNLYGACLGLRRPSCEDKNFCKWFFCGVGSEDDRCARQVANKDVLCSKKAPALKDEEEITVGGLVYPPNLGSPTSLGYYKMPLAQKGEYVFSESACDAQRYGSKTLTGVLYTVALNWKAKYPGSKLRIGDLNATGHLSHNNGVDVDITVSDFSAANTSASAERSIALGKMFIDTGQIELIYFGDDPPPAVATTVGSALNSYAVSKGLPYRTHHFDGHNDHFHVRIYSKYQLPYFKPGC